MRRIFAIGVLVFSILNGHPQSSMKRDSLVHLLETAREDTNKVKLLLAIESRYFNSDADSAIFYNKLCEALIRKINAKQFLHRCFHEFVRLYHAKSEYRTAMDYCLKSLKVAEENNDKFQLATSYRALFNLYYNLKMPDSAMKYAVFSLNLTNEIGDTANVSTNYGNLCRLYKNLGQYGKAIEYGNKGIEMGERYKDSTGMLVSINNLAVCYLNQNNNLKAIELFRKQYQVGKLVGRVRSIRNALTNLVTAYYYVGDGNNLSNATALLNQYDNEDTDISEYDKCCNYLANSYNSIFQRQYEAAGVQLLAAKKIAESDSVYRELSEIYQNFSTLEFARQNFKAGNGYMAKVDSMEAVENQQKLSEYGLELEEKYETGKKESQLKIKDAQLKNKTTLNYLLVSAGVGMLIISLLLYRTYWQKQKLQQQRISELETEKQLMATEAVLKGEEQERTRLAKDLHDGLGGMLSGIKYSFNNMKNNLIMTPENNQAFERSMDMLGNTIKEMRRVAHNMMPEALVRYGLDKTLQDYVTEINKSGIVNVVYESMGLQNKQLDNTTSITIYRIVQELLNNVVKHAGARQVLVQLLAEGDKLVVSVEDDGKGFDTSIIKQVEGIGWKNIQSRIDFLKGKLEVQSAAGKGTNVNMEFTI